eukprot:14246_1
MKLTNIFAKKWSFICTVRNEWNKLIEKDNNVTLLATLGLPSHIGAKQLRFERWNSILATIGIIYFENKKIQKKLSNYDDKSQRKQRIKGEIIGIGMSCNNHKK